MAIRVFLGGHGILRQVPNKGERRDKDLTIPPGVQVFFYCDHGEYLDDTWEAKVRLALAQGKTHAQITGGSSVINYARQEQSPSGKTNLLRWHFKPGEKCANYRLGYGGGLHYTVSSGEATGWHDIADGNTPLVDPYEYYVFVDDRALWIPLAEIVTKLKAVGTSSKLEINWLACRESVIPDDKRFVYSPGTNRQLAGVPKYEGHEFLGSSNAAKFIERQEKSRHR